MSRLEICPFEYNPSTNQLKVFHNIKFEIQFLKADLNQTRLNYAAYNQAEFSPIFNQFINRTSLFLNKDVITTHPTTYVIVSDRSFEQVLQPFVDWKVKKGFNVIEASITLKPFFTFQSTKGCNTCSKDRSETITYVVGWVVITSLLRNREVRFIN